MGPIHNLPIGTTPLAPPQPKAGVDPSAFKDLLLDSLGQVNQMQASADRAVEQLFTGGDVNMPEVLTSIQKADLSFKMMLQIRNKLVSAYQEIQNIRI